MGLDQYAYIVPDNGNLPDTDHNSEGQPMPFIGQWRKHPNLQGWMENLYRSKGGNAEDFNCVTVRLTEEDLRQLLKDIENNALPHTEGFFFGVSDRLKDRDTVEFALRGLTAIRAKYAVYYGSWW